MLLKSFFILSWLWASEPSSLMDLKKNDFSFLIEGGPKKRCLLKSEAALALIRVQKELQLTGNRLKLLECYVPDLIARELPAGLDFNRGLSRGGAVAVTLVDREGQAWSITGSDPQVRKLARNEFENLKRIMQKEGFEAVSPAAKFFVFKESKQWPILNIPLTEIP